MSAATVFIGRAITTDHSTYGAIGASNIRYAMLLLPLPVLPVPGAWHDAVRVLPCATAGVVLDRVPRSPATIWSAVPLSAYASYIRPGLASLLAGPWANVIGETTCTIINATFTYAMCNTKAIG